MKPIEIGTVYTGSIEPIDLLLPCSLLLDDLDEDRAYQDLILAANDILRGDITVDEEDDDSPAYFLLQEIIEALNDFAPDFTYFGDLEVNDDPTSFGFYVAWDDVNESVEDGDIKVVSDLSEIGKEDTGYILLDQPDTGTVTLLSRDHDNEKWEELWSTEV